MVLTILIGNQFRYIIKHGHNPEMIRFAKSIKAERLVQIQQMQSLIAGQPFFTPTGIQHQEANKQMTALMMDNLPQAKKFMNTNNKSAIPFSQQPPL